MEEMECALRTLLGFERRSERKATGLGAYIYNMTNSLLELGVPTNLGYRLAIGTSKGIGQYDTPACLGCQTNVDRGLDQ